MNSTTLSKSRKLRASGIAVMAVGTTIATGFGAPMAHATTTNTFNTATDTFSRTASTLGTSDSGATWAVNNPDDGVSGSTSNGSGVLTVPNGKLGQATMTNTDRADIDARLTFTVPNTSGTVYFGIEGRTQADGSGYTARVQIRHNGSMFTELRRNSGVAKADDLIANLPNVAQNVKAGDQITLRLLAKGTTISAQAAINGADVSTAPAAVATDSTYARGAVGVRLYNGTGATLSYAFDNISLNGVPTQVGSLPVGQASYPTPANAIHVATSGSDSGSGTAASPYRSVAKALSVASAGSTIVVHGGTYHESLGYINTQVTIQNAPGEAVWFDGSEQVTGWTQSGNVWVHDGWNHIFKHGHTLNPDNSDGTPAPDGNTPGWQFVNAAYPMAANPDMMFLDGKTLQQVDSASKVTPGTFFYDETAKRLIIGDNPSGHRIDASSLQKFAQVQADGTVIRGVGIRRYATTMNQMAALTTYAANVTYENLDVEDSATLGIGVYRHNVTLHNVTVNRTGMLGIAGNYANGVVLNGVKVTNSNTEKFYASPGSAGVKFTRTVGFQLTDSAITDNYGAGVWLDEEVRDSTIARNTFTNNDTNGIYLELNARAKVVGNTLTNNGNGGDESLKIVNTNHVLVENNTIVGPRSAVLMWQDTRSPSTQAHFDKENNPAADPDMTWRTNNVQILNNVLEDDGVAGGTAMNELKKTTMNNGVVLGQDNTGAAASTMEQMVSAADGNIIARPNTSTPRWVIVWQGRGVVLKGFETWDAYRAAHPDMDAHSTYLNRSAAPGDATSLASNAVTPTSDVAALLDEGTNQHKIGA